MTSKLGSNRKSSTTATTIVTTSKKATNLNKSATSASSVKQIDQTNEHTASSHNFFQNDSILEDPQDSKDKLIIAEYLHLLDKSRQLFNSLRELPQYGHKTSQWQAYFGRTFDVYTKLWKYQQQHRHVLEQKHNLKRWQIGEIASKIGQLYYHYYLRTSDSNYLNESYSFYQAIQNRSYYTKANKEEKPDLMVKKLRYYARFIVVCLLLKKSIQVKELIKDLGKNIDEYIKIYDPEDQLEWQLVRNEINDFIEADSVLNLDKIDFYMPGRIDPTEFPEVGPNLINKNISKDSLKYLNSTPNLSLQEILIVGNCNDQIKFSELSLDMFRMLQAVEREPIILEDQYTPVNINSANKSSSTGFSTNNVEKKQEPVTNKNPYKYLLYKPTFSQFYTYLTSAFKDLPPYGVLLVYLSADSHEISDFNLKNSVEHSYDFGGLKTNTKKERLNTNGEVISTQETPNRKTSNLSAEIHCIYPGDLYPLFRKPLFLIVDSPNSQPFKNFPNRFGQPFVSFLAPIELPIIFHGLENQHGSILTLFLSNSLLGFCYICQIKEVAKDVLVRCQSQIKTIYLEIAKSFYRSRSIDQVYIQFCRDDILRGLIFRYVFCYITLRLHRGFKGIDFYPSCQPYITNDIIENTYVKKLIIALSTTLNIRDLFLELNDE